jgi:hypothetical protein
VRKQRGGGEEGEETRQIGGKAEGKVKEGKGQGGEGQEEGKNGKLRKRGKKRWEGEENKVNFRGSSSSLWMAERERQVPFPTFMCVTDS